MEEVNYNAVPGYSLTPDAVVMIETNGFFRMGIVNEARQIMLLNDDMEAEFLDVDPAMLYNVVAEQDLIKLLTTDMWR